MATVTGTGGALVGNTPTDYAPGTGYKLRIVPDNFNINTSIAVNVTLTRPAPPEAQTSYAYCPGENPTQLTAKGDNLRWYNDSGQLPGAPNPPKDVASSYNVTQTVSGCQSNFTTIKVSIKPKSDRPNVSNKDYCQNEPAKTLSEAASGANLKWYESNGTTELSGDFRPGTGEAGNKTYRVSQEYNGCRSDQAEFSIRVKPRPGAPGVKSAESVCQNTSASSDQLRAAVTSGNDLRWYETEQGGAGNGQVPNPRTGNAGLQTYFVSQTLDGCEGPRAKVEQEIKSAPSLPTVATNPVLHCLNDAASTLSATGNQLKWYRQANGGNSEASISISTDQVRTDTYYVTQTGTNGCESGRQSLEVRINPKSDPPGVSNREYCRNDPAKPLSELTSGAAKPKWYDDGNGSELNGDFRPGTGDVGNKTYQVTQEYNGCRSDPAKFNIRVKAIPAAPVTQKAPDICQLVQRPNAEISASARGEALRWYETEQGGAGRGQAPNPLTGSAGQQNYFVSQTVEGCESPRSKVKQTVLPAPALPTVAANPVLRCLNEAVAVLTASGVQLKWYRQANGGSSEPEISTATDQVRTDTYYVTQTGTNGCESGRQSVEVRVLARPTAPEVTA
ncbi:MAG: hypothetical protein LH606_13100, partial [Cytophagaceae bacterium]|nr:hypothetical protein [Cytophagaceae bacterium]